MLTRFEAGEALSEPFEFRVDALSEQANLDFNGAIGRNCLVTMKSYLGAERSFNGVLVEAQWVGVKNDYYAYRLVLRPWLWLLGQKADCKIFTNKTAPDIIKKVFSDAGFTDFRDGLTESYPEIEYCVQYRETDFAFVSRLMEQYGVFYFFEHSRDKHMLVLADAKSSLKPIPGSGQVPFIPLVDKDRRDREHVYHWMSERRFRTGKVAINDYDYLQPNAQLLAEAQGSEGYNKASLEAYDFPGKYPRADADTRKKRSDGDKFAKVRLEAEQALDHRRLSAGDAMSLFPGGLVDLKDHPNGSENGQYLIVRASHVFVSEAYRSVASPLNDEVYYGHYEFLPSDRPYRAPLVTPKPLAHGPQTAKVVGKDGEEIDVDEHGRITVQFHWDRDKKPSRRVRVAQVWSGKSWGGQVIPRIGQEVVVDFLEGDPDRPLVVGTVYNNDYKYPYELPGKKTISGVKSDSTKGGGGYNEFIFEDKKGSEQIGMHAEKDLDVVVKNNETRDVGVDQTIKVGQKIFIKAGMEIKLQVGGSSITIDNTGVTIKGTAIVDIEAPMTTVKGTGILTLKGGLVLIN